VGGNGVFVGIAAWVCATIVWAPAIAVLLMSSADMVGGAGSAPHAVSRNVSAIKIGSTFLNIFSPL